MRGRKEKGEEEERREEGKEETKRKEKDGRPLHQSAARHPCIMAGYDTLYNQ